VFIVFLLVFIFDPFCFRVLVGRGFAQSAAEARTVHDHPADSPFFQGSLLEVLLAFSDSLRLRPDSPRLRPDSPPYTCGQSSRFGRTVRVADADSPPLLAGQSASAWLLCSLV
jgi:hypothetical protein